MNNGIKAILAFSLGAATGSLVACKVLKNKYEQITKSEIEAYREYANQRISDACGNDVATTKETKEATDESDDGDPSDLANLIGRYRSDDDRKETAVDKVCGIYVISPEEYGTRAGYDCTSLTYFADGVLADEWDNVIQNPDGLVGEDFETHFGDYEDDSVFIRNEELERDFEILRDLNTFVDTMNPPDDTEG